MNLFWVVAAPLAAWLLFVVVFQWIERKRLR